MPVDGAQPRVGFNSLLRAEAEVVLRHSVFRRSPVLSKLLRYLVEETANGRADRLKSFVVATDGLGKSDNFDPASDSSARVQMVRLRKTLESYYAQQGPGNELCLYLQPGSYTVRLGNLAVAYPMLYRPLQDNERDARETLPESKFAANVNRPQNDLQQTTSHRWLRGVAIVLLALAIVAIALFGWRNSTSDSPVRVSPVLELMPLNTGQNPAETEVANLVIATLQDNLPRFKLSRIRIVDDPNQKVVPAPGESVFRLYTRLQSSGTDSRKLYVQVRETKTNTTIWSRELSLPSEPAAIRDAMAPLFPQISGPFGIVTTHNMAMAQNAKGGGYPCILKYVEFMAARTDAIEEELAACFEKPIDEEYIISNVLATRAMFTIERTAARSDPPAARLKAMEFARAAIAADPNDAFANYAVARLSYGMGDCVSALFYTKRAVEGNPNSPVILGMLAALAEECDYPDAGTLLDRAILIQNPHLGNNRLLLVLAALSQGRPEKVAEIGPTDLPASNFYRQRYYLAETLIAASKGKRAEAAQHWVRFSSFGPPGARTPEERLHPIIPFPDMQQKLIAYLRSKGVQLDATLK